MAITTDMTNTNPMIMDGIVYEQVFTIAEASTETPTSAIQSLGELDECDVIVNQNEVFAELVFSNALYNDKTQFFGVALSSASYVNFFVQTKSGGTWSDLFQVSNSTYGVWQDVGDYTAQPKLATFYLDWATVLANYGEGHYRIKTVTAALGGGTTTTYSDEYYLRIYSAIKANGTVVFNWFQNGKIFNNKVNFTGLNIEQWLRVKGMVTYATPEIIVDEIEKSSHEFIQIQDRIEDRYEFESELLDYSNMQRVLKDVFLGNEIYVTDYNYYNHAPITELALKPSAITEVKTYVQNKCAKVKATMKAKTRDTIKRNYF